MQKVRKIVREKYTEPPIHGPVRAEFKFYFKGKRKGDLSNYLKGVEDSCSKILYEDDKQIIEEHVFILENSGRDMIEIEVSGEQTIHKQE